MSFANVAKLLLVVGSSGNFIFTPVAFITFNRSCFTPIA